MAATSLRTGFTIAAIEAAIEHRLRAGEKALVVGGKASNFPTALMQHPQLILWESGKPYTRDVPQAARIVLFTKWLGHHDHQRINREARTDADRIVWPELLGTGEIRRLLRPLIETPPAVEPAETPPTIKLVDVEVGAAAPICDCGQLPGGVWPSSTREFVELHWTDEDRSPGWQTREANRLHRLAAQHGLSVTLHYVVNLVSQLNATRGADRDEVQLSRERAERAAAAQQLQQAATQHVHDEPQPATTPAVEATPQAVVAAAKAGELRLDAELVELLRMIGDAQAVLALARETVEQLARQNAELKRTRDTLRAKVLALAETL